MTNIRPKGLFTLLTIVGSLTLHAACHQPNGPPQLPNPDAAELPTWEEFSARVHAEDFDHGVFIVDGDIPIHSEKALYEYWEDNYGSADAHLIVHTPGGTIAKWSHYDQHNLTYCVDANMPDHDAILTATQAAMAEWENVADVQFVHMADQDTDCDENNDAVLFDVREVSGQGYLARAFFPDSPRVNRNVLVDGSAMTSDVPLVGIMRHELGHVLGFRHEHTRPEAGTCYEDNEWTALTDYDQASVMHYPHCNGTGDWSLQISPLDAYGAASLYGGADGTPPTPPTPPAAPTKSVSYTTYNATDDVTYMGPFDVDPGSEFWATITGGAGDQDVYVRFDAAPTMNDWVCRPFPVGNEESCRLTVPSASTSAYVMVHGWNSGHTELTVEWEGADFAGDDFDDGDVALNVANSFTAQQLADEVGLTDAEVDGIVAFRPFHSVDTLLDAPNTSIYSTDALFHHGRDNGLAREEAIVDLANSLTIDALENEVGLDSLTAIAVHGNRPYTQASDIAMAANTTAVATLYGFHRAYTPAVETDFEVAHALFAANHADHGTLDSFLDVRAADDIVAIRPFVDLAGLDDARYVGDSALNALAEWGADNGAVGPVDAEGIILYVANTATLIELDDDVGLDSRAAQGIVDGRPFYDIDTLDAVSYVGPSAMDKMLLWGGGGPDASTGDAIILDVANTATLEQLDDDIGLDVRAAEGIVDGRPFATIDEVDAVPYVGQSALDAMLLWGTNAS